MTIYSKTNTPEGFYTYAYLRKDGTPYYIGKGCGARAWKPHRRSSGANLLPKDTTKIIILAEYLSESEAHYNEKLLIIKLGRKDLGTGILRNMTDGGEGSVGRIVSELSKDKIRGEKNPAKRLEVQLKIRQSRHGQPIDYAALSRGAETRRGRKNIQHSKNMSGEGNPMFGKLGIDNPNYGKKKSVEDIAKTSGNNHGMFGKNHSEETLLKMRVPKTKSECIHCGAMVSPAMMSRWHGNKCKIALSVT